MATVKITKNVYPGWRVGDLVEASGERLKEILDVGGAVVTVPDPEPTVESTVEKVEKPKKKGRPFKKGV